jgi:galactokinase
MVPFKAANARVVICNTMVRHELGASEYNKRRAECEEGVRLMRSDYPGIKALRDVTLTQFDKVQSRLPQIVARRCRHVISENERTVASVAALSDDDLHAFGKLMNESHDSLCQDYEVSCAELDAMVQIARDQKGVLGARMTGGGFGGCTVNLVAADQVDDFVENVSREYEQRFQLKPVIVVTSPAQGAREL